MRIYMQLPSSDGQPHRFYHLLLQQDLLEGWTLIKETGRQGASGRVKQEHYSTREQAEQALMRARDEQINRGYRIVFVEGEPRVRY